MVRVVSLYGVSTDVNIASQGGNGSYVSVGLDSLPYNEARKAEGVVVAKPRRRRKAKVLKVGRSLLGK